MHYDQVYIDSDGQSHFGDVEVEMTETHYAPPAPPIHVSEPVEGKNLIFFRAPVGWMGDSHTSPRRQFYVGLAGELEVTVSSGEARRYGPGGVLLLEDVEGAGHVTAVVGDEDAYGLFVHLE